MPDHLGVVDLGRQMADPAAHQIEQHPIRRQNGAVKAGQRRNRPVVDMANQPRRLVEDRVVLGVELGERITRQPEPILHVSLPVQLDICYGI